MILLREIQKRDLSFLKRVATIPGFINLPNDSEILEKKIEQSIQSFSGKIKNKKDLKFVFVAEDLDQQAVVATSMVASQHGTPEAPHLYFQVGTEQKFSSTINTGFIHGTLELKYVSDGPSEIGGLVVDPKYRTSDSKIGRQISFVRFLFMGQNLDLFKDKTLAELLPPINRRGQSPLWEAVGRRFTSMDYWEADNLCKKNKEFIFSLFPTGKIYTTFFSAEARNAIGKVNKITEPVVHMLNRIGFEYKNQVDPFDGGPHLWATTKEIKPIQDIVQITVEEPPRDLSSDSWNIKSGLLSKREQADGTFRAVHVELLCQGDQYCFRDSEMCEKIRRVLNLEASETVSFMPYYRSEK